MRHRPVPIVLTLLLLTALAPAAGAVQWRCGADEDSVWSCHDANDTPTVKPTTLTAPAASATGKGGKPGASPAAAGAGTQDQKRPPQPSVPAAARTPRSSAEMTAPVDERWKLCPPAPALVPTATTGSGDDSRINLYGDTAETVDQKIYTLRGNAVVLYGQQKLTADTITYNLDNGAVDARGNLRYAGPGLYANGAHGQYYPDEKRGTLYQVDYSLPERHGRGQAEVVHILDPQHEQLDQANYTTCAPGNT